MIVNLDTWEGLPCVYLLGDGNDWLPGVYTTVEAAMEHARRHIPELTWKYNDFTQTWYASPRRAWSIYRQPAIDRRKE